MPQMGLEEHIVLQRGKSGITDAELWNLFKSGDKEAYSCIYKNNIQALYEYGMYIHPEKEMVKDAIQELFVHIWQRKNHLGTVSSIRSYLFTGLRRKILTNIKQQEKSIFNITYDKNFSCEKHIDLSYENQIINKESEQQRDEDVRDAIESLPPRQKEIIYLSFYKNLSYEEVSEIMSINVASVYTLTWKAIKSLKKRLRQLSPLLFLSFLFI